MRLIDVYDLHMHARARAGAVSFLYELLAERPPEANISHQAMPTLGEHERFVNNKPYRFWYLIEVSNLDSPPTWVGAISATVQNEIGIAIAKRYHRLGYAIEALRRFRLAHTPLPGTPSSRNGRWLANVAMDNEPSHALFRALGGRQIQITYEL